MKNAIQAVNKISQSVERAEELLLYIVFIETIIVGMAQVLARFVFRASLPWSEELLRMSFEWVTFFGASVGINRNTHVAVVFFTELLPSVLNKAAQIIGKLVCVAFFVVLIRYGWIYMSLSYANGQRSTAMELPMVIPYGGMVLSFVFMLLHVVAVLLNTAADIFQGPAGSSPEA